MKVSWTEVATDPLLARTHHITVVWRDKLVVHGGLMSSKGPPLNSLATWSPTENDSKVQYMTENGNKTENDAQVEEMLTKTKGPSLSHHAAALVQDDLLLLVGGWDGKARSSKVWHFSFYIRHYIIWCELINKGFPVKHGDINLAGDSKTSCVVHSEGKNVRTQS